MKKLYFTLLCCLLAAMTSFAQDDTQAPAFPGAEGHGRYTTGGRGGEIRHVTNLNDTGTGSFREAVKGDAKKIVVFDVGGIIALESELSIGANTTIEGQTAPGDGITLRYYTVRPKGDNIIMRFIRVRRGQEKDVDDGADAIWTRNYKNIVLDHCSFSWSIDEVASFYDNKDFTMQWCTIGEALNNAGHDKGAHGYGGIWGGKDASFHHNMIIHVNNRAPRFNGARYGWTGYDQSKYSTTVQAERVDFRNCVMYNWGDGNGCYGGPGGGFINIVNNYYKAGPSTNNRTRVTECSVATSSNADSSHPEHYGLYSKYYISGNYVTAAGSSATNYDWSGVKTDGKTSPAYNQTFTDENNLYGEGKGKTHTIKLENAIDPGTVTTHSAENAFSKVLDYAGASYKRDAVDARYATEARNGTTTYTGSVTRKSGQIDLVADQGTYTLQTASRPSGFDTDGDGMPDEWEIANGLNPNSNDANLYTIDNVSKGGKGWYTNIEVYANSLVEDIMKNENKDALSSVNEYYPTLAGGSSGGDTGGDDTPTYTQTNVSEAKTWDWSKIISGSDIQWSASTTPSNTDEVVMKNIPGLTFDSSFDAQSIVVKGEYPYRGGKTQNTTIKFHTTVAGTISVDFSDTGSSIASGSTADRRYLNVNGTNTTYYTQRTGSSNDKKTGCTIEVPAGDVVIKGMKEDGTSASAICIYKIVFTPSSTTPDVPEGGYPLTATWDFTSGYTSGQYSRQNSSDPLTVPSSSVTNGNAQNLTVDVTSGKFNTRGSDVQVNAGTKIRVPVTSNSDVVTVTVSSGYGSCYTIGGSLMVVDEVAHTVTNAEAAQGYVEIAAVSSGYIKKITVLQNNNTVAKGNKTVTYYDYNGTTRLGTQTVTEGDGVGTFQVSTCTVPSGYTFGGWFTATGLPFTTTSSVINDMAIYPYIYKVENGYYMVPAGCGNVLLNTLKNIPAGSKVFLPNGTYDFGTTCLTAVPNDVSIIGQSQDKVIIRNTPLVEGIGATATLMPGNNNYMQDLSIECSSEKCATPDASRCVTIQDKNTRSVFKNVSLLSGQDTYYSNGGDSQQSYFENCYITGTVDYICGGGDIVFKNTTFYNLARSNGDVIFAPATKATTKWGYVALDCIVDGATGQAGNFNIARDWQGSPAAALINTEFKILPTDAAYSKMSSSALALRFHEYNSHKTDGTVITGHNLNAMLGSNDGKLYLTAEEAAKYTLANIFAAGQYSNVDAWDPTSLTAQATVSNVQYANGQMTWTGTAPAYLIEDASGNFVAITTSTSYAGGAIGYTVRAANGKGGFGVAVAADGEKDATLAFTASVQRDGTENIVKTKDSETHYYNNWGTGTWRAQSYIGFDVTVPEGKQVKSATLHFSGKVNGGSAASYSASVYCLTKEQATAFNYETLGLSNYMGDNVGSVTDVRANYTKHDVPVSAEIMQSRTTSGTTSLVIFQVGGSAGGAFMYGSASTSAPTLDVEFEDIPAQPVANIIVSPANKTIAVGETLQLSAQVLPAGANQSVTWRSEDTSIAEVDDNGKVTANKIGTVNITATATDGRNVSDFCVLTVVAKQSGNTEVVYSWESPSGTPVEIGGTIAYVNGDGNRLNYSNGGYYTICLNGKRANINDATASANAGHMEIELDKPLAAGDKFNVTAYYNKGEAKDVSMYMVFDNNTEYTTANFTADIAIEGTTPETKSFTIEGIQNSRKISLTRGASDTNLFITKIEIVRESSAPSTPTTITKYISSAEWASFVPSENVVVPSGVKVYYAKTGSYDGSSVVAVPVATGETIAKNTGFFINGTEGNYLFNVSTATPLSITDNMLLCGANATIADGSLVFGRNYINDVLTVGFFPLTSYDILLPEGIVYIDGGLLENKAPQAISVIFDEATGIRSANEATGYKQATGIYNLSGQKVGANYKGIVIINGKKVLKR